MTSPRITITDVEGLKDRLLEEQYSTDEIQATENFIKELFCKAAFMVFHDTLARPLPESIEIRLFTDDNPVLEVWRQWFEIASLDIKDSHPDHFVFHIREYMFRSIIDEEDNGFFIVTAIEEMIRAADLTNRQMGENVLEGMNQNSNNHELAFGRDKRNPFKVLFKMVRLLLQYRSESIAILGGRLLTNREFELSPNSLSWFRNTVLTVCQKAQCWLQGEEYGDDFLDMELHIDDSTAVSVLLRVMLMRGDLRESDLVELKEGFKTGNYSLSQEERKTIIERALSLSIKDYWEGLLSLTDDGESLAPQEPIMDFVKTWEEIYGSRITDTVCVNF
jgi:hypothetical protein